jgi:hypothetical protein
MALDPDAPRQTSRYAVVAGETYLARYIAGHPDVILRLAPGDEQVPGFERDPRDSFWTRTATWDEVERLFQVDVWWRLRGYPVTEVERAGDRVLVQTGDDPPYRRPRFRRPRGLKRAGDSEYSGWVEASALSDRCEVEIEWNPSFFRMPADQWPTDANPGPILSTVGRRKGSGGRWEVLDLVDALLQW